MVIEVIKCACGLDMVMRGKSADIGVCMNCDGVQAGEKDGPRVLTARDHAFHKALSARVSLPRAAFSAMRIAAIIAPGLAIFWPAMPNAVP